MVSGPPLRSRRWQSPRPLIPREQETKGSLERHSGAAGWSPQSAQHRAAAGATQEHSLQGRIREVGGQRGFTCQNTEPSADAIQGGDRCLQMGSPFSMRPIFAKGWMEPAHRMTHVGRVAGAAGNDYPQPQRTGQFHGTQGALDRDPSRVERPHPSLRCHGPPSRSTGARDRRTREGRLSGKHSFWKHVPCPQAFPL